MFDLSTLLDKIPDEYKPLAAFGIGSLMLVVLAMFHGAGLHLIFVHQRRRERRLRMGRPRIIAGVFLFGFSIFLMLTLHIAEILLWASALRFVGFINRAADAVYFCANAYTTLGMGTLDVGDKWRNVSPIIGISGLFTFAWTTSALVDVVARNGRLLGQLEEEREQEMHMRAALRKEEWEAVKRGREAVLMEREKAAAQVSEAPSSQRRHEIREEERKKEAEIRRVVRAEMMELLRKERQAEERLGMEEASEEAQDKEQGE
jgi:hypothetical protein